MDAMVGTVFDATKSRGLWDDAVVVFWGDHGWKLGHHSAWAKHTDFRTDTNSPLIIKAPGVVGRSSNALVEHVDLMATLVELAGLEHVPLCPEKEPWATARCTEGTSLVPLLQAEVPWKNASYSQYPRGGEAMPFMGYSMTTNSSRFTAWVEFDIGSNTTNWSMDKQQCGFELYDHASDPEENVNVAAARPDEVSRLFEQLKAGWRATRRGLDASLAGTAAGPAARVP